MQCVIAAIFGLAAMSLTDAHMIFYEPCPRDAPWTAGSCEMPDVMIHNVGVYGTTQQNVQYTKTTNDLHTCGSPDQTVGSSFKRTAVPHYNWKEGQTIAMSFGLQVDHNALVNVGYFSYDAAKAGVDTEPDWFSPIATTANARTVDPNTRSSPAFVQPAELPRTQLKLPLGSASPYGGLWASHLTWHSCVDAVIAPAQYVITDQGTGSELSRVVHDRQSTVSLVIDVVEDDALLADGVASVTWTTTPASSTVAPSTVYPYTYVIDPTTLESQPTSQLTVTATVAYTNGRSASFSVTVNYNELCGNDFTCSDIYSSPAPNRQCNGLQCTEQKTTYCCRPNETCGADFTQAECVAVDPLTTLNTATKCTTPQCTASQCCDDNDTCSQTCPDTHYPINRAPLVRCPAKECVLEDCCAERKTCKQANHACTAPVFVAASDDSEKQNHLCDGPCTDEECCDLAGQCVPPTADAPMSTCDPESYPLRDIVYGEHYCPNAICDNGDCCYTTYCSNPESFDTTTCFYGYRPLAPEALEAKACAQDPCLPATCCEPAKTCAADFVCATSIEFDHDGKRHTFHPKPNYAEITCAGDECTQAECCDPNDTCSTFATCGVGTHNPAMLAAEAAAAAAAEAAAAAAASSGVVAGDSDEAALQRRLLQVACTAAEDSPPVACPDGSTEVGTLNLETCEWSGCTAGRDGCVGATCAPSECCVPNQSCASHACPVGMVAKDFTSAADRAAPCTGAMCLDSECCITAPTCDVQGPTADVCGVTGATGAVALLPTPEAILCDSANCRFGECCSSEVTCGPDFACAALGRAADQVTAAASGQVLTVGEWTARAPTTTCRGTACVLDECCAPPPLRGTCAAFACPLSMIPLDLASLVVCTGVECTPTECCTARVMCPSTPEAQATLCGDRAPLTVPKSCSSETCTANECCQGAVTVIDETPTPVTCASFVASPTAVCNGALPVAVRDPASHNCPEDLCEVADCCVAAPVLPTCATMTCGDTTQLVDAAATVTCGTIDCTTTECCVPLTCRDFSACDSTQRLKTAFATLPCAGASCTAAVCCEADVDPTDPDPIDPPDDGGDDCKSTINELNQIIDCNGDVIGTVTVNSSGELENSSGELVDQFGTVIEVTESKESDDGNIGMIIGVVIAVLLCVALALLFFWRRQNGPKTPGAGANMRHKPEGEMDDDLTGESVDTNDSASISVDQGEDLMF